MPPNKPSAPKMSASAEIQSQKQKALKEYNQKVLSLAPLFVSLRHRKPRISIKYLNCALEKLVKDFASGELQNKFTEPYEVTVDEVDWDITEIGTYQLDGLMNLKLTLDIHVKDGQYMAQKTLGVNGIVDFDASELPKNINDLNEPILLVMKNGQSLEISIP